MGSEKFYENLLRYIKKTRQYLFFLCFLSCGYKSRHSDIFSGLLVNGFAEWSKIFFQPVPLDNFISNNYHFTNIHTQRILAGYGWNFFLAPLGIEHSSEMILKRYYYRIKSRWRHHIML